MSLALLFHYLLLNVFRMLVHPSSEDDALSNKLKIHKCQTGKNHAWIQEHQKAIAQNHSNHMVQ